MKKITAIAFSFILAAACMTACGSKTTAGGSQEEAVTAEAAVSEAEEQIDGFLDEISGEMDLSGSWEDEVSQRAGMDVTKNEDGSYDILVHWGSSAFETAIWEIHGTYDPVSGMLSYDDGKFYVRSVDKDENETVSDEETTEGAFMKEGEKLRWQDSRNTEDGLFVKMPEQ